MIEIAPEVRDARAVVALETTLVAHGFPPGEGVAVGLESERAHPRRGRHPGDDRRARRQDPRRPDGGRARPLRRVRAQGRAARPRRGGRAGRGRRDDRRRNARGLPQRRHRGHGDRRARRRSPRLEREPGRLRRISSSSPGPGPWSCPPGSSPCWTCPRRSRCSRRLGVPVLGFRTDELPLFYSARGGPPVSARVESRGGGGRDRARTLGARTAAACCSRGRRTRASTTSSR